MNPSSDKYRQRSEVLLEILRIGVVALRNLAAGSRWFTGRRTRMIEWSELCHGIPVLLHKDSCGDAGVRWFLDVHAAAFLTRYPRKRDADFIQVAELIEELQELERDGVGNG